MSSSPTWPCAFSGHVCCCSASLFLRCLCHTLPLSHTHTPTKTPSTALCPFPPTPLNCHLFPVSLNGFSGRMGAGASEAPQPSVQSLQILKKKRAKPNFPSGGLIPERTEAFRPSPHADPPRTPSARLPPPIPPAQASISLTPTLLITPNPWLPKLPGHHSDSGLPPPSTSQEPKHSQSRLPGFKFLFFKQKPPQTQ